MKSRKGTTKLCLKAGRNHTDFMTDTLPAEKAAAPCSPPLLYVPILVETGKMALIPSGISRKAFDRLMAVLALYQDDLVKVSTLESRINSVINSPTLERVLSEGGSSLIEFQLTWHDAKTSDALPDLFRKAIESAEEDAENTEVRDTATQQ